MKRACLFTELAYLIAFAHLPTQQAYLLYPLRCEYEEVPRHIFVLFLPQIFNIIDTVSCVLGSRSSICVTDSSLIKD
jgi:hypothetical protein